MNKQSQNNAAQKSISFTQLFRFATRFDLVLMTIGTLASIVTGTALPIFAYISGSMIDAFQNHTQIYQIYQEAKKNLYYYLVLGVGAGVTAMAMFTGWTIAGQRQSIECRKKYFRSIIRQEVAWFDTQKQVQISNNFSTDAMSFQLAVGQKISTLIMLIAMTLTGLGISFYQGWILSCVILAYLPFILFCWYKNGEIIHKRNELVDRVYVQADSRAQQSLSAIRSVKQMNAEEFELQNNARLLEKVREETRQSGVYYACSVFFAILSLNLGFTLSFWYGSECVFGSEKCPAYLNRKAYTAGSIIKIFYSLLLPAITLNQLTPCIQKISQGKAAAGRIFKILDRQPLIKSKENALRPASFRGIIVFDKVGFSYPKNKGIKILDNLDLIIDCRNSAIVGDSGCGKSTIFQLMMRFYDADEGRIYLDGVDIRDLDVEWLRSRIGYVQQEPTLFAVSLRENLLLGKEDATDQELVEALKKTEAYEFFQHLKDGFDTFVGNSGCQLSGGQKQRIAIARSLLKSPKILLLDEATSALDRKNERQILTTLKKLGKDFVTISITHRMKVLEDCDKIYTFRNKKIERIAEKSKQQYVLSVPSLEEQLKKQLDVSEKEIASKQQTVNNNLAIVEKDLKDRSNAQLNFEVAQDVINSQHVQEGKLSRIAPYLFKNRCMLIVGTLMGILDGLTFPILGVMLAQIITAQIRYTQNKDYYSQRVRVYCYVCLGIAIFSAIWNTVLHLCLFQISANSIKQLRHNAYNKILKMPIPWFDMQQNHPEKVINHLSVNSKNLSSFIEMFLPHMVIIVVNILFCVVGSVVFDWRTGLTSIALIPLILVAQTIQFHFVQGFNQSSGKIYEQSSQIISESIMNIRTILALQAEILIHRYQKHLSKIYEQIVGRCFFSGMMYGISYFLQYITIGLIFFFSAIFITNYSIEVSNSFAAIFLILFACTSAGNNAAFLGDLSKAKNAANNLFSVFEMEDQEQMRIRSGSQLLCKQIKGDIVFKHVSFRYETRETEALRNVSFDVRVGQKVDLVGSSGCGKSTVFSLLLGFYQPTGGSIFIDGININDYDLHHLRKTFGVVSQEPTLFNESISWNIKYNHRDALFEQVIKAAKLANFYPTEQPSHLQQQSAKKIKDTKSQQIFRGLSVEQLMGDGTSNIQNTLGFNKNVGPKGSHISGGQKQRIAIARALLRNPTVYLLDEATSALDPQNQKTIQKSLERIMANKTTLGITHQLEAVEHSPQILVFNQGQIVQRGNYKQLCSKGGEFCRIFGINKNI